MAELNEAQLDLLANFIYLDAVVDKDNENRSVGYVIIMYT